MESVFSYIEEEIKKYSKPVHLLSDGIDELDIIFFEEKYRINIPLLYKEWLRIHNGGEFFALPVGVNFAGILGDKIRKKGVFYLEDNFDKLKHVGVPKELFIIGDLCDGEIIAFDLKRTNIKDGCIIQYDPESGKIIDEWNGVGQWLMFVFEEGKKNFYYNGDEKF